MSASFSIENAIPLDIPVYSFEIGQERLEQHEKWIGTVALNYIVYMNGGYLCHFLNDFMKGDREGRYNQVHYLVWRFADAKGEKKERKHSLILLHLRNGPLKAESRKWMFSS